MSRLSPKNAALRHHDQTFAATVQIIQVSVGRASAPLIAVRSQEGLRGA